MSKKPKFDPAIHDENPEWTAADFAKARPAAEVLPADLLTQFKAKVGRPRSESPKVPVKIRLDSAVVEALRATGDGWQTRINDMLKAKIVRGKVKFDSPKPAARKRA
ncbi:BrnA antitoxin family protein [Bradyrhizobium sp. SZCCHNR3118]|uniref:BrnA antitoxin family protein n=1 Tax=Bradyrhizobium sp. SZCCHNR3118 TaxID=3057468 RepID=UPI002916CCAC|nr:BrnA antitoxin family protein [Bradyrhizobium sp. SZCCHNR3118]